MTDVYIADDPHCCQTPERKSRPVGSIWQCDECGAYWTFRYTEASWGPVWDRVKWWQWRVRRRIAAMTAR